MKPLYLAGLAAALLGVPQQQGAPTFRSAASVIEVDVIVRDRDGAFVEGLTAADFEVLEDGKPHAIQQFYLVKHAGPAGAAATPDPAAPRGSGRMFIFAFDLDHLSADGLARLKAATETFITGELGPMDVAGIVANGRMAGGRLTSVKPELLQAVRSLEPNPDTRAARLRPLREFPRIDSEFEAARMADGDARLLREATERVCGQTPVLCQAEGGNAVVMERLEQKARQYIDEARGATGNVLRSLSALVNGLGRLPGRKTLVLMTDGFFAEESLPAIQQIAGQASRNGVAIYGLDGRGLSGSGTREMADVMTEGPGLSRSFDTIGNGPHMLAQGTGGFVIRNASHFAGALSDIARDTSTYYVLGYAPANAALDGSFRKIEVKAKTGAGLQVRARKGYLATPLPAASAPRGG